MRERERGGEGRREEEREEKGKERERGINIGIVCNDIIVECSNITHTSTDCREADCTHTNTYTIHAKLHVPDTCQCVCNRNPALSRHSKN